MPADAAEAGAGAGVGAGAAGGRAVTGGSSPQPDGEPARHPRGADLALAALQAAKASNAARRAANGARRTGAVRGSGKLPAAARLGRRRWSGPGPDKRRDPQPLGVTLQGWAKSTGAAAEITRATLFARWAQIVGPGIADHCAPVSLVDGELVVQAESTAWATQLRLLAATLRQKINADIGRGTVTQIRARGPVGPSWRFGNRHVPGRGPRDTYG